MIKIPNFLFHILGLDAVAMETIISSSTYDSLPLVILRVKSSVKREKKKCWRKTSLFFHHGNFFFFRFPAAVSSKIKREKKKFSPSLSI